MSKSNLLDLLSNIRKEEKPTSLHYHSRVLIVDGMNTFLRCFAAINQVNLGGHHIGGLVGFLKSIRSVINDLKPTRVIIALDGESGSLNRKYLNPEYKANRNKARTVNYKSFNTIEEEDESKSDQFTRLIDYLFLLPVTCMCIDKLEADDIMAYVSKKIYDEHHDSKIYLMSADKDFYQLINDRISVYSPIERKFYYVNNVLEKHGVHPENFLIYKTLLGDNSDNLDGVLGIGEKKILKLLPQIAEPKRLTLKEVYEHATINEDESKLYSRILEAQGRLEVNYKIMNLREPYIYGPDLDDLNRQFYRERRELKKLDFIKLYNFDKLGSSIPGLNYWLDSFSILNNAINNII